VTGTFERVCRDPKDDMLFECAVKAESEIILSGDKDLLSVKSFCGIQVLTVREYLERFTQPRS
jgi:predicted nucleic acid-binding protein